MRTFRSLKKGDELLFVIKNKRLDYYESEVHTVTEIGDMLGIPDDGYLQVDNDKINTITFNKDCSYTYLNTEDKNIFICFAEDRSLVENALCFGMFIEKEIVTSRFNYMLRDRIL